MVYRESAQVFAGADGIYTGSVYRTAVAKCAAFTLLWTLMSYVFVRSLHLTSVAMDDDELRLCAVSTSHQCCYGR